jgi:seryl-tRNA synthetase
MYSIDDLFASFNSKPSWRTVTTERIRAIDAKLTKIMKKLELISSTGEDISVQALLPGNQLILEKLDRIERKLTLGEEEVMSAIEDLKNIVAVLVDDAVAEADEVRVAVDLLKQLVEAGLPTDDPEVVEAVEKLEAAHERFQAATQALKDEVDNVSVSGGVVYNKE